MNEIKKQIELERNKRAIDNEWTKFLQLSDKDKAKYEKALGCSLKMEWEEFRTNLDVRVRADREGWKEDDWGKLV